MYNGERLTEEIVDYAKKMNGPAVMDTSLRPEDIDGTIFGYYGPKEGPLWVATEFCKLVGSTTGQADTQIDIFSG